MMEYQPLDRLPHWELGAWGQAHQLWEEEGAPNGYRGDWFSGIDALGMDRRIFAPINFKMVPWFDYQVIEEDERTITARNGMGIVTKGLKTGTVGGTRLSMDEYIDFPVKTPADFAALTKRYDPHEPSRYPANWDELVAGWRTRDVPLVLGHNCLGGFYWNAREWMGTEGLSVAFYDQPELVRDMFEFLADFLIAVTERARRDIGFDYFNLNEDLAFKSAPLVSPRCFRELIFPPLKRLIEALKGSGVKYISVDTDGNPTPLIPQFMEAGVDVLWPIERAAEEMDPAEMRRKYGESLRLWGGVDKREVARGPAAIDAHLRSLAPLVAGGGFVPTLDHCFPHDISLANMLHYNKQKQRLLRGELGA
ncbi:MAG: hypothetical protein HYU66_28180 [Armatimonadetes bacterium]|nr:hypothetical protein [Armatimonadota bacterium]